MPKVNKIIIRKEDLGKVPDQFPELRCVSRIYSEGGKCYMPYYKAEDVWIWFQAVNFNKILTEMRKRNMNFIMTTQKALNIED